MKLMKMFNQDMGYGPDAKVLKPQKLINEIISDIKAQLNNYNEK